MWKNRKKTKKVKKTDMIRNIGKQSEESAESDGDYTDP